MTGEPTLRNSLEIERMRLAAEALERVLAELAQVVRSGTTTADIENVVTLALKRHGLEPVLDGYRGYPAVVCTSVNNVAAHGLPGTQELRAGDLVTVDISADRDGWKADAAWTYGVPPLPASQRRLRRAAWRCTLAGARAARSGARLGDIGAAIEVEARRLGCEVVREFTGHGIGKELHEPPVVPHAGSAGGGLVLPVGAVVNIEPVVSLGTGRVTQLDDGWSFVTADGSLTAQYEVTVAVREQGPEILTLGRLGGGWDLAEPPYG
jgi:methionyl aminopeptidase